MSTTAKKRTYWFAVAFYLLIVFEFVYMASPFAFYFYSVYKPGLNVFNHIPMLAWLPRFFLPHLVVETTSPLIDLHNVAGVALATLGLSGFIYGAVQVYYAKLTKKGAVTKGIYNYIRHPQYTALIVWGFGLLLLWPRYIVLVFYITMLFIYYLLAKLEENECKKKFGEVYIEYKDNVGMFLPIRLERHIRMPKLPSAKAARAALFIVVYLLTLSGGIGLAKLAESYSRDSLYTYLQGDAIYISLTEIDHAKMKMLIQKASDEPTLKSILADQESGLPMLNYIVPSHFMMSEISMNEFSYSTGEHFLMTGGETNMYKIIYHKAIVSGDGVAKKEGILKRVTGRIPLLEIWISAFDGRIVRVLDPPENETYEGVPMPIF
jgi:protein-S-isoprenylcysteine O-methyltransferase Ste14